MNIAVQFPDGSLSFSWVIYTRATGTPDTWCWHEMQITENNQSHSVENESQLILAKYMTTLL